MQIKHNELNLLCEDLCAEPNREHPCFHKIVDLVVATDQVDNHNP